MLSVAAATAVLVVSACSQPSPRGAPLPSPAATADRVAELRRPLPVPANDGTCRPDRGVYAADFPGAQGFVPGRGYVAFGPGPVAPAIHTTPEAAVLSFGAMATQDGQVFEKIIWIVTPGTRGPVLVRAIAADGSRARFMDGNELHLPGPGTHPEGYVYFPGPGCYTFQADHPEGTQRITVLVRP